MLQNLREESKALIKNLALALIGRERECRSKQLPQRESSQVCLHFVVLYGELYNIYERRHCMRELFFSPTTTL